jgi:hypothetical protein
MYHNIIWAFLPLHCSDNVSSIASPIGLCPVGPHLRNLARFLSFSIFHSWRLSATQFAECCLHFGCPLSVSFLAADDALAISSGLPLAHTLTRQCDLCVLLTCLIRPHRLCFRVELQAIIRQISRRIRIRSATTFQGGFLWSSRCIYTSPFVYLMYGWLCSSENSGLLGDCIPGGRSSSFAVTAT